MVVEEREEGKEEDKEEGKMHGYSFWNLGK